MDKKLKVFTGEHCETTAVGTLLRNIGIEMSEAMIFGLGEGLGYGVLNFGKVRFPFIGGRIKTGMITENICENLNLKLNKKETTSKKKAWNNIKAELDRGRAVGLQLDSFYLEYFTSKVHFAGHFVGIIGYDQENAYLCDTNQQGGAMKTSLNSLEEARSARGPMSRKNLSFTIEKQDDVILEDAIYKALRNNALDYLNPPIRNFGYKGIEKTVKELEKWYDKSEDVEEDFVFMATMMEKAGTGGALFRNIYRDFLKEAWEITSHEKIYRAYKNFEEAAPLWNEVTGLYNRIGKERNKELITHVQKILRRIKELECSSMEMLSDLI